MGEPKEFGYSSGKGTILRFTARMRDSGLSFSTPKTRLSPRYRVARGGNASIGTTGLINVRVSN